MYGRGISKEGEILDLAVRLGIIQKSGSWFTMNDTRLGQGRDNVKDYLHNNPELLESLTEQVRANLDQLPTDKKAKPPVLRPVASANVDVEVAPAAAPDAE